MLRVLSHEAMPKGPPCVLDIGFSLSPTGLYWVLGLTRALPVWLPQCHWAIVDDKEFPVDQPLATYLASTPDFADACTILERVRQDWRDTRDRIGFEACPNIFWPMDGRSDSVVPKNGDATLIDRLHILAAGLDNRVQERSQGPFAAADTLSDCARDTLALAAALREGQSVILSPLVDGASEPLLARHLDRAGIPCSRIAPSRLMGAFGDLLMPALLASGLAVRLASGRLRLAGLIVVAPGTLAATAMAEHLVEIDDDLEWDPTSNGNEAALWDDATAIWWELS
jgi:hypothetical protein